MPTPPTTAGPGLVTALAAERLRAKQAEKAGARSERSARLAWATIEHVYDELASLAQLHADLGTLLAHREHFIDGRPA